MSPSSAEYSSLKHSIGGISTCVFGVSSSRMRRALSRRRHSRAPSPCVLASVFPRHDAFADVQVRPGPSTSVYPRGRRATWSSCAHFLALRPRSIPAACGATRQAVRFLGLGQGPSPHVSTIACSSMCSRTPSSTVQHGPGPDVVAHQVPAESARLEVAFQRGRRRLVVVRASVGGSRTGRARPRGLRSRVSVSRRISARRSAGLRGWRRFRPPPRGRAAVGRR